MARAPSYDFERRDRQKAKEAKRAEKTKAKAEKKAGEVDQGGSLAQQTGAVAKDES